MYNERGLKARKTKEDTDMKKIEFLEQMKEQGTYYKDTDINQTFGQAYFSAQRTGNDLLDFNEVIWDTDIEAILENSRRFGITEFTISSNFSGLIPTLAEFEKRGCRMDGLTEVKAPYTDFTTGELQRIPAVRMTIG